MYVFIPQHKTCFIDLFPKEKIQPFAQNPAVPAVVSPRNGEDQLGELFLFDLGTKSVVKDPNVPNGSKWAWLAWLRDF